jgi:hypothetical protein
MQVAQAERLQDEHVERTGNQVALVARHTVSFQ